MGEQGRLGCWILVYERTGESVYHNHYLAKRLVSSDGYHGPEVPGSWLSDAVGLVALGRGINKLGEGMFFLGRLYKAWVGLRDEFKLEPSKHKVKVTPAEGYVFPRRLFTRRAFRGLINGYTSVLVSPLAIWDDPLTFSFAIGLSAAIVLFLYFLFKEVSKFL